MAHLGDVTPGCAALFGLRSNPGQPGHSLRSPASRALRDAAHIESPGAMVDFRRRQGREDGNLLDLGNLDLGDDGHALANASREIARRSGLPILLGGTIDDALVCLESTLETRPHDAARSVFISPGLEWAGPVSRMRDLVQRVAVGTHDFISRADLGVWKAAGGQLLSASAFTDGKATSLDAVLGASPHRDAAAFVVVDMSSVDMGHAAGASRDNVGGLEPAEFLAIVGRLASTVRLLGMAIVNLAPDRDPRGHSERLAARALLTLLDPRLQRVVA
jgi:hypothetical protein